MDIKDGQEYVSVAEAAEILGMSRNTIYRRVYDGSLKSRRIGNLIRIPKSEVMPNKEE
jgi:excisionase family DNA binding protein